MKSGVQVAKEGGLWTVPSVLFRVGHGSLEGFETLGRASSHDLARVGVFNVGLLFLFEREHQCKWRLQLSARQENARSHDKSCRPSELQEPDFDHNTQATTTLFLLPPTPI
jgi:hypothetical protein